MRDPGAHFARFARVPRVCPIPVCALHACCQVVPRSALQTVILRCPRQSSSSSTRTSQILSHLPVWVIGSRQTHENGRYPKYSSGNQSYCRGGFPYTDSTHSSLESDPPSRSDSGGFRGCLGVIAVVYPLRLTENSGCRAKHGGPWTVYGKSEHYVRPRGEGDRKCRTKEHAYDVRAIVLRMAHSLVAQRLPLFPTRLKCSAFHSTRPVFRSSEKIRSFASSVVWYGRTPQIWGRRGDESCAGELTS